MDRVDPRDERTLTTELNGQYIIMLVYHHGLCSTIDTHANANISGAYSTSKRLFPSHGPSRFRSVDRDPCMLREIVQRAIGSHIISLKIQNKIHKEIRIGRHPKEPQRSPSVLLSRFSATAQSHKPRVINWSVGGEKPGGNFAEHKGHTVNLSDTRGEA